MCSNDLCFLDASPVMDLFRSEARSGGSSPSGAARTGSRPDSSARSPQSHDQGQRRGAGRPNRYEDLIFVGLE